MPRREGSEEEATGGAYDARLMRRLWAFTRPHRRLVAVSLALFPAAAVVELAQPYLIKVAVDDVILARAGHGLHVIALLYLASLGALYGLRAVQSYVMQLTGQRVMHDIRRALFAHLQRLDARFFERQPVGRLMTRVLGDVEAVNELFVSGVVVVVGDVVTLAGVVAVMLWMNWRLALVMFAVVPVLAAVAVYFRLRARAAYRRVRSRLAELTGFLQEAIQGMSVIQIFARERAEAAAFGRLNGAVRAAQFRSTLFEATLYASVEAIGSAAVALLLWYAGGPVLTGTLTFGALVAFLEYTHRFFLPIRDLGAKYTVMQAAMVSSERIFDLLDTAPAIVGGTRRAGGGGRVPAIEFRNVWFAYEGAQWVLRDCSFTVGRGETVALVGATGEGKTTVVRLLTRAWDPARGHILVDGVDVREWDLGALRRHVGLVPQDAFLFAGTVRDNLTVGVDGVEADETVARALALANAERVVRALPHGLGEEIRERGANLSQGERQLLAIARALIYNPSVLALDEATSSIDVETEALIRSGLERLLQGRTSVIIAHRLATIQSANRILVLHKGRIREAGRHSDLLALGGIYARLHELQFGPSRP